MVAAGPSRGAPEEAPGVEMAPGPVEGVIEEGELQVPPAEAEKEIPTTTELVVVVLDPEDGVPADAEPVEAGQAREEGDLPAPPEPEVEKDPSAAEEGEIMAVAAKLRTSGAGEAEMGKASTGEVEAGTPPPKIKHLPAQRIEDRLQMPPLWPVPRSSTMEDGVKAECLLGEMRLPEI